VYHLRIESAGDNKHEICDGQRFSTVNELIQFYFEKNVDIRIKETDVVLKLKHPLSSAPPTNER
jgi:hypothetical protein